jgi:DNA-binding CsgD family transcriptional regulator
VGVIFQQLFQQLCQSTRASEANCRQVAARIMAEVERICSESRRIQASGDVTEWVETLASHRLKQCLRYYKLGSKQGRVELQSNLSAIVYRYISSPQGIATYQEKVALIEDFLQNFYVETLNAWRRENSLNPSDSPKTLLDLAEYMAFSERYAKRRISLPGGRSQQLIILRSQTFSQQQPHETTIDMELVSEVSQASDQEWNNPILQQLRANISENNEANYSLDANFRETIIKELIDYFEARQQPDCIDYFILRLQDLSASEIEKILGLDSRQRDYLQQRFKYHLLRFSLSHRWELVHQWLEADLEKNLGLTPRQWQSFQEQLTLQQEQLLQYKQQQLSNSEIAKKLGLTTPQVDKKWLKLLETAWEIRNNSCL